jgi:hypothetical protein
MPSRGAAYLGRRGVQKHILVLLFVILGSCGPKNSLAPVLTSLSPSSATREGTPFDLIVTGANFVADSSVLWNGESKSTRYVSSTQLTALIATSDILVAGTDVVTVLNPSSEGGTSNSLPFSVPCVVSPPSAASSQSRARLGAYYFDGWSGPLTNFHYQGMPAGPYVDREPLSGWQDSNSCAVEQQLALASAFGINFFVFDWYYNASAVDPGENLNSAFELTRSLQNHHGMQYALLYVNSAPFVVEPTAWSAVVSQWVTFFQDPDYLRIRDQPVLFVIDMTQMRETFGSSDATAAALNALRTTAQANGLPGVFVVGGFGVGAGAAAQDNFPDLSIAQLDGYDAVTLYGYPFAPTPIDGMLPFSALADAGRWIWSEAAEKSPVPFITVAMDGWDPRPWNERESQTGDLVWYERTPEEVATFVGQAITFAESNPQVRPEPAPAAPLVLVEAWNELGEGSYILPTVGDGQAYGDALAALMELPSEKARSLLTVADTGGSSSSRSAKGSLTDESGLPTSGASISLAATPVDGEGLFTQYHLSGQAPAAATSAIVAFRVNVEGAGPGASNFSLYQASYVQGMDGMERVSNDDFSSGLASWDSNGQAELVANDRGPGQMVLVLAEADETAALTSAPFTISGGATFEVVFEARVAPSSFGSGYFAVIFLKSNVEFVRQTLPLKAGSVAQGTTATDATGAYSLGLASLGSTRIILEANYAGDAQHWPGYARAGP